MTGNIDVEKFKFKQISIPCGNNSGAEDLAGEALPRSHRSFNEDVFNFECLVED